MSKQTYKEFAELLAKKGRSFADSMNNEGKMERLGTGIGRVVYSHPNWPFLVFKFEFHEDPLSNQSEWMYYEEATRDQRKFLAKPFYLSKDGTVLVMERVSPYFDGWLEDENRDLWQEMESEVGERMWDCETDHNIGGSGVGPKLYDYADQDSTFWHELDGPYEESYYSSCDCPNCKAIRGDL